MSTYLGDIQSTPISQEEELYHYFEAFSKAHNEIRVGLEAEFFGINKTTGRAIPYDGPVGIQAILMELSRTFDYEAIYEEENIIALKRGKSLISLEPGGQVELSAPPAPNIFEIEGQIHDFLSELRAMRVKFPEIDWLAVGIHPFSNLADVAWVPKQRYKIMADYFKTHGELSLEMMKLTATNQINFDYLSEENAMDNLRVVMGITSIVSALFSNSSFSDGKPNGFLSRRLEIWNHTDPARSGLILEFAEKGRTFRDYVEYLLRMPVIFVVREGKWVPIRNLNFRDFIRKGYGDIRATVADFELHLSTAFPEVRLKHYLEIRGIDCQSPDLIAPVAAFWKGILYDAKARESAWDLVAFATKDERLRLHQDVPRQGLHAKLGGEPIFPIAQELVDLSCASLARQITRDEKRDECQFLGRIRQQIIKPQRSPAETLLKQWCGALAQDFNRLIQYLGIQ